VILGYGTTTLGIRGIGKVKCTIGPHTLNIPNVRYVPGLAESIYSLFLHIKQPDHGLQSSFDYIFPSFHTTAVIGSDDIYLDAEPHGENNVTFSPVSVSSSVCDDPICRHTTVPQNHVIDTSPNTHLLDNLRQYYSMVQTKCQLSLDVPAGFRQASNLQREFQEFLPPSKESHFWKITCSCSLIVCFKSN